MTGGTGLVVLLILNLDLRCCLPITTLTIQVFIMFGNHLFDGLSKKQFPKIFQIYVNKSNYVDPVHLFLSLSSKN